ncbi:MAG: CfrBI family restriction endonuclease [Candidatus Marsarchaeota archaeon]|nr:CfrBI family restriction endonuclease [Candidatus Marsarchaeota archaeon]
MTSPKSDLTFDLKISELRESLQHAVSSYAPIEVREIVHALFTGQNYRNLTEKPTRQAISVFAGWILNLAHRACLNFDDAWKENLLTLLSRRRTTQEEKWLRLWLLGLTQKTAVNLGIKSNMYKDYQQVVKTATEEAIKQLKWQPSSIELSTEKLKRVHLSPNDSVWLLQIAGAAVLTIRGSKKATAGKRLEKAIARAALNVLGLTEGEHFWLNVEGDVEVEREIDAEIITKRGRIRMDIALIGTGNQEVSEDKLGRVGRHGIVLVDLLGPTSQVLSNAARHEVQVIQLRNNFALTALYSYLKPLMPAHVLLAKPPANKKLLGRLLGALPDNTFALPN